MDNVVTYDPIHYQKIFEPSHEKNGFKPKQKQRHRSAVPLILLQKKEQSLFSLNLKFEAASPLL